MAVEAEGYLTVMHGIKLLSPAPQNLQPIQLIPARRTRLEVRSPDGQPIAGARIRPGFDAPEAGNYPIWPEMLLTAADGGAALLLPAGQKAAAFIAAPGFV